LETLDRGSGYTLNVCPFPIGNPLSRMSSGGETGIVASRQDCSGIGEQQKIITSVCTPAAKRASHDCKTDVPACVFEDATEDATSFRL
jgi:hypothetical protein